VVEQKYALVLRRCTLRYLEQMASNTHTHIHTHTHLHGEKVNRANVNINILASLL
jgi:hypothetical protein